MRPVYFLLAVGTVLTASVYDRLPSCVQARVNKLASRGVMLLRE